LALAPALADPWPNYPSQTTTISYVTVTAVNTGGTTWQYTVTLDPSAAIRGVKALAVYPNAGNDAGIPGSWSDQTALLPGWDLNGGWETGSNAFQKTNCGSFRVLKMKEKSTADALFYFQERGENSPPV